MSEGTKNKEETELDYPEGTLGWIASRTLAAVKEKSMRNGIVFVSLATILLLPAIIELLYYSMNMHGPLLIWRAGVEPYNFAQWHMVVYVVVLLMFAIVFFYCGARLIRQGLQQHNKYVFSP